MHGRTVDAPGHARFGRWLTVPAVVLVVMTGFAVAPAGATARSVTGTGICFGDPASGGCSFIGGSTTAIAGSTEELGAALTATDGVNTGDQIVLDGTGTGITFSSSVGDFNVVNHSIDFECQATSVSLSNSGQTASVTMPGDCAATAGASLAILASNTVMPAAPGTFSLSLSTTQDIAPVATNSLLLATLPSAPKDASASRALQSIVVSWNAPDSLGDPALTGYNVYCSTGTPSTADTPSANTDAATTSATISSVSAHTTYNCVVTAVNAGGQSDASNLVSAVPYEVPDAPGGVSTAAGDQTVTVSWSAPEEHGGTRLTGYHAYCSTTYPPTIGAGDLCGTFRPSKRSGVIRGLANGVPIYVGMTTLNAVGESILSSVGNPTPTGPPAAPRAFRANPFHQSIQLRWKVPTNDGGDPITDYDVWCSVDNPPVVAGLPSARTTANFVRVHGLTTGTPYYCVVLAENTRGLSRPSSVVTATPL